MYVLLSLRYRPISIPSPIPLFNYIGDQEESNCVLYIILQLMSFSSLARAVRTKVHPTSEVWYGCREMLVKIGHVADECWLFEPKGKPKALVLTLTHSHSLLTSTAWEWTVTLIPESLAEREVCLLNRSLQRIQTVKPFLPSFFRGSLLSYPNPCFCLFGSIHFQQQ